MRRAAFFLLTGSTLLILAAAFAASTHGANAPTVPTLAFSTTSWAAPTTTVGAQITSSAFTVTFSGKGNSGPLYFGIGGGSGGQVFSTSGTDDTCTGATLSPKNPTCTVKAIFAPTDATTYNSTLWVYGRKLSASATLSGTGQEATPGLSINDAPWVYSNNKSTITFTVTLNYAAATGITFDWTANDWPDTAAAAVWGTSCDGSADYTSAATTGSGLITAGNTFTTITFGTCDNGPAWGYPITTPTYFTVTISNPSGATITTDTGKAEIVIS